MKLLSVDHCRRLTRDLSIVTITNHDVSAFVAVPEPVLAHTWTIKSS